MANKFGRLANGIGGSIKNPTNTIEFITNTRSQMNDESKMLHMGNLCAQYDPKRLNPIKLD